MAATIDVVKSVKKGRLVYVATNWEKLVLLFNSYGSAILGLTIMWYKLLQEFPNEITLNPISFFIYALTLYLIVSGYFLGKLITLKCGVEASCRQFIQEELRRRYKNIQFENWEAEVATAEKESSNWKFNKRFTLLFTAHTFSINLAIHDSDNKWTFLGLPNYLKCRQILKQISRQIAADASIK